MNGTIRRQEHGIRAKSQTITLPADDMERLKREAAQDGITVSRHVVNLIRLAWSVRHMIAKPSEQPAAD